MAGLFLFSASVFAQGLDDEEELVGPNGETEPVRFSDDARRVFLLDFEGSADWDTIVMNTTSPDGPTYLYTWQAEPVDSITQVTYYKRNYKGDATGDPSGNTNIYDGSRQWEVAGVRDTTMLLFNGVMRTDAGTKEDTILNKDKHKISAHDLESRNGANDMGLYTRYGEDGEDQYFTYISARGEGAGNWSSNKIAEYRRNLFVRLDPGTIEENSSYRVTVFVRAQQLAKASDNRIDPTIALDLMRGYFHSEKSFMVDNIGYETTRWVNDGGWKQVKSRDYYTFSDKTDYKVYSKEDDFGKWQKITLMAYYNNDYVGNASPYLLGYYWSNDWEWKVRVDTLGNVISAVPGDTLNNATLKSVQQPDKYFVRMSFRSDSTQFDVDNLSLTKSWIGGVEHYNDMIRVDFGYQTNMGDLAQAALEQNKIAAVELPGRYFDVWMHYEDGGEWYWEYVPILSAEYHGDGYMYMWTKPYKDGSLRKFLPDDEVLVSFTNPVDTAALRLVYKGNYYPNGLDSAWVANGKEVFDFHNEISSYNPTITTSGGKTVRSLKNLPPVLQEYPHPDGTFGLLDTDSLVFKFSRKLYTTNTGNSNTNYSFVTVTGNGVTEYWTINSYEGGRTVINRPAHTDALKGDYVIYFDQVTHLDDAETTDNDDYGDDVVLNLHFGDFERQPAINIYAKSNWRNEVESTSGRPYPTSIYIHSEYNGETFRIGDGKASTGKCGLYPVKGGDCMMYLSARAASGKFGNLYTVPQHLDGGVPLNISFKAIGWGATDLTTTLYVYPKPATEITEANGYELLNGIEGKTVIGTLKPEVQVTSMDDSKDWPDGTKEYKFSFSVPSDGDYIFEWKVEGKKSGNDSYFGVAIGNYTVQNLGDLSFEPVSKLNEALDAADTKITLADNNPKKYKGAEYEAVKRVKAHGDGFIDAIFAANQAAEEDEGHSPIAYAAETKMINDTVVAMQLHIDTVDAFFKAYADVEAKLAVYADSLKAYQKMACVKALQNLFDSFVGYDCSVQAPGKIAADTKLLTDALKAVEDRQALNDKFSAAIVAANEYKESVSATYTPTDEYAYLVEMIVAAGEFDVAQAEDEEINAMMLGLADAQRAVEYLAYSDITTLRIKRLNAISQSLGVDYDADLSSQIANVKTDDDNLAEIMKEAIKDAIYEKIMNGEEVKDLDLTPFIKNYHLYATPVYNEAEPSKDNGNTLNNVTIVTPGAQIQKMQHRWNDSYLWLIILDKEFDNLFPGWNVVSDNNGGSGNRYANPDDENFTNLKNNTPLFDGSVTLDWGSKVVMSQSVTGLPVGTYSLSLESMWMATSQGDQSKWGVNYDLSATIPSGDTYKTELKHSGDTVTVSVNGIEATDVMDIALTVFTNDNPAKADNFSLIFNPLEDYDYEKLVTVVDFTEVEGAEYEYYTLNWLPVAIPEKGQVYFRKSGNVVEKVIFK